MSLCCVLNNGRTGLPYISSCWIIFRLPDRRWSRAKLPFTGAKTPSASYPLLIWSKLSAWSRT